MGVISKSKSDSCLGNSRRRGQQVESDRAGIINGGSRSLDFVFFRGL